MSALYIIQLSNKKRNGNYPTVRFWTMLARKRRAIARRIGNYPNPRFWAIYIYILGA